MYLMRLRRLSWSVASIPSNETGGLVLESVDPVSETTEGDASGLLSHGNSQRCDEVAELTQPKLVRDPDLSGVHPEIDLRWLDVTSSKTP